MTSDLDIYRTASVLIREHGDEADLVAALSANIHRRHMTKGQQAMAVACNYPEPGKGGRGKKSFVAKEFSGPRLSFARTVLAQGPTVIIY